MQYHPYRSAIAFILLSRSFAKSDLKQWKLQVSVRAALECYYGILVIVLSIGFALIVVKKCQICQIRLQLE